jgi:hypothetical protein
VTGAKTARDADKVARVHRQLAAREDGDRGRRPELGARSSWRSVSPARSAERDLLSIRFGDVRGGRKGLGRRGLFRGGRGRRIHDAAKSW